MKTDRQFDKQEKPFVVFSTTTGSIPTEFPYNFKIVAGCFNNGKEKSFITCYNGLELLRGRLVSDGQRYYLYVDEHRNAFLIHINETIESLTLLDSVGKFQRATESEAHDMSAWTYDSSEGQYWIVR